MRLVGMMFFLTLVGGVPSTTQVVGVALSAGGGENGREEVRSFFPVERKQRVETRTILAWVAGCGLGDSVGRLMKGRAVYCKADLSRVRSLLKDVYG